MSLRDAILDAAQLTSLILVFVTTLFGIRYPVIMDDLAREVPVGSKARQRERQKLVRSLLVNCLPPLIANTASAYLLSPLAVTTIRIAELRFWNFDIVLTSFMFVVVWVLSFAVWSWLLFIRLLLKILCIKPDAPT